MSSSFAQPVSARIGDPAVSARRENSSAWRPRGAALLRATRRSLREYSLRAETEAKGDPNDRRPTAHHGPHKASNTRFLLENILGYIRSRCGSLGCLLHARSPFLWSFPSEGPDFEPLESCMSFLGKSD